MSAPSFGLQTKSAIQDVAGDVGSASVGGIRVRAQPRPGVAARLSNRGLQIRTDEIHQRQLGQLGRHRRPQAAARESPPLTTHEAVTGSQDPQRRGSSFMPPFRPDRSDRTAKL